MGLGDLLLRILYTRVGAPRHYYSSFAALVGVGGVVADVGGGSGLLYHSLPSVPRCYLLVDPDPVLAGRGPACCAERVVGVAEDLPLRGGSVDSLVLHDALHHFSDPAAALGEAARVTRGCIYVRDYEARGAGRLLWLLERLLGFPARFLPASTVAGELGRRGFRVVRLEKRGFSYTLVACRNSGSADEGY